MLHHHFIIVGVEDEDGRIEFYSDEGSLEHRFTEGTTYDDENGVWYRSLDKETGDSEKRISDRLFEKLK